MARHLHPGRPEDRLCSDFQPDRHVGQAAVGVAMEPTISTDNRECTGGDIMPDQIAERINSCKETVRRLEKRGYAGIHVLSAFILLSIGATRDFAFMPSFSATMRKSMGAAPSPGYISIALAVYVFSAATLSLSRMMEGTDKTGGIAHLGYLGAFFFFYHMSSDMDANFWAVFAAGVTILGLESYQRWYYCREEIQRELEMIASLEKRYSRQ